MVDLTTAPYNQEISVLCILRLHCPMYKSLGFLYISGQFFFYLWEMYGLTMKIGFTLMFILFYIHIA